MRVVSCLLVLLTVSGLGCAAPRAFVLSDPDKPLPGSFGDEDLGLQASAVDANIVSMPAGNSFPLGSDVTSMVAETMNRGLAARSSAEGLSTTVTVRETVLGTSQVFGVAVETKLPDGSVVATQALDTDVASQTETSVVWGLAGVAFCCGVPVIVTGGLASGGIIIFPLLVASIVMAFPAIAAAIALPFARSSFADGRIRAASNLVVSAVRDNAAAVRERLRGGVARSPPPSSAAFDPEVPPPPPPTTTTAPKTAWFYAEGQAQRGPVDDAGLADAIARGAVRGDSLVWHEGLSTWRPARDVDVLAGMLGKPKAAPGPAVGAEPRGPPGVWHYAVGDEKKGPVDGAALVALLQSGAIGRDTLVWQKGMAAWQPVRDVKALQPHLKSRAPPVR